MQPGMTTSGMFSQGLLSCRLWAGLCMDGNPGRMPGRKQEQQPGVRLDQAGGPVFVEREGPEHVPDPGRTLQRSSLGLGNNCENTS